MGESGFVTTSQRKKRQYVKRKHTDSGKEKFPGAAISKKKKKVILIAYWDMKNLSLLISFKKKSATVNNAFYCQLLW